MRHKLDFKCEYCEDVGEHICLDRLVNHFIATICTLAETDMDRALAIQDTFLDTDSKWWEDQLGDVYWEEEEDEG
jgi:hypothetical protein